MHNSYWFLALIISSIIIFIFILFKRRNTETLFLLLAMIGLGFIIETVIFTFLGSYEYYPNFIKDHPYYDNNLGAFTSNAFALPVIATLISTFSLNWIWMIVFAGVFVSIEWLFLKLQIYSHNWWKLGYTGFGLPIYFATAKVFYQWILNLSKGFKQNLILYLIIGAISCSTHLLPIIFFSNRIYSPGWFANLEHDTTAFSVIFYLCDSLYYCLIININWKKKWVKYALTGLLMYAVNQLLVSFGILQSLVWWDPFYYIGLPLLLIFLTGIIDKRLSMTLS
ncbi:hypothetical protein ACFYKT_15550 [Cytobacillus sp. FJAT-53684]|uniref:Uncharacterized protein n=1 Tax=Cytobacillus mangrovibacter TaxID=3299024 RepID=A0ABW6K0R6_9BACI